MKNILCQKPRIYQVRKHQKDINPHFNSGYFGSGMIIGDFSVLFSIFQIFYNVTLIFFIIEKYILENKSRYITDDFVSSHATYCCQM